MDLTSSWVLLLVVFLGGGIALYADRLGRNLGKKRLKLGSLRPRRTAEIIVFAAGMLTPFLAILAIMGISAEARQWIARGYGAVRDARAAIEARDLAITKYDEALKKAGDLDIRLKDQEDRLARALTLSSKYEGQAKVSEDRAKTAVAKAGNLESKVQGLSNQVRDRQATLEGVQSDLSNARTTLQGLTKNFATLKKQKEEAEDEVSKLNADITSLQHRIDKGQGDLTSVRGELAQKQAELKQAEEDRKAAVDALQNELTRLNNELAVAENAINVARMNLNAAAQKWLTERLIFRIGEEVSRLAVGKQLSQSEAEKALDGVIYAAQSRAEDEGAAANSDGKAADLIEAIDRASGMRIPADVVRSRLVKSLIGRPTESVLVARVPVNIFANQFVPIDVAVFPNPIVFKEGEVVGEARIDSALSVGRLFESIGDILRDQVRKKAEERGMIPIGGKDDAYGSVTPDVIFSLITAIQATGRTVRLQILAKDDTHAAGPLALDFRLR